MRAGNGCRIWGPVLAVLWLSACGESEPAYEQLLRVSTKSLSFTNNKTDQPVPPQRFGGEILNLSQNVFVGVAFSDNGLEKVAYDLSTQFITIEATPKLPSQVGTIGTFEDQIVIAACEDFECKKHLAGSPAQVQVSYTVSAGFSATQTALSFTQVLGSSVGGSTSTTLGRTFPDLRWTFSASQPWLRLLEPNPSNPSSLGVMVDPAQEVQPELGTHQASVTVSNPEGRIEPLVLPVTVQVVAPTFTITTSPLNFGPDSARLSAKELAFSLNTVTNVYDWTATVDTGSDPQWVSLSRATGKVSNTWAQLVVSVDPTGLTSGTHTAQIILTAMVRGTAVTQTIPVSLTLAPHGLWVSDNGVALVSTPSVSRRSHTVKVKDLTGQRPMPWTASSNQPWLSVTASSADTLTVTADPTGLAADTLHLATVTVRPDSSTLEGDTVQVGLWVGASASNSRDTLSVACLGLAMDPVRPYAYVHDGAHLSVYNVYTAGRVGGISALGTSLSSMTLSTDGATLYVLDQGTRIIPVNLNTLTAGSPWAPSTRTLSKLVYARPSGHGVISSSFEFYDAAQGGYVLLDLALQGTYYLGNGSFSGDGSVFCGSDASHLGCYDLRYRRGSNFAAVTLSPRGDARSGVGATELAVKPDGSRVYAASAQRFRAYDTRSLSSLPDRGEDFTGDKVAVGVDDRLYGVAHAADGAQDVWVFDDEGTSLGSFRVAPAANSVIGLGVSGDGQRFAVATHQQTLDFISSP